LILQTQGHISPSLQQPEEMHDIVIFEKFGCISSPPIETDEDNFFPTAAVISAACDEV
jgi:hypothetical protein